MRTVGGALLLMTMLAVQGADERTRPLLGAIRWDAWSGGPVTEEVERSLGPQKYHFRLPFFAKVLAQDKVEIRGGTQEVMDREIDFAAGAGLDYWAFVMYPEERETSIALRNYLASAKKDRIRFSMILHHQLDSGPDLWPKVLARFVRLMKEPTYQTVLEGRSLVFMFNTQVRDQEAWRFKELRKAAADAGLKDPYLVYMGFNPSGDKKKASALGFDALSSYANPGQGSYAAHAKSTECKFCTSFADLKVEAVPLASAGWDKRPRMDHPVSWEKDHSYHKERTFVETAKPAEIAAHIRQVLDWTAKQRDTCPAQAVIVYGWNENDEGGWLVPTLREDGTPDTSRLDAIRKKLDER